MPFAAGEALALRAAGADEVQGLRRRRRGRPHARRRARNEERRLGPGSVQPGLPDRLERLRHRRAAGLSGGSRHARRLVRAVRLASHRHGPRHGVGPRDPGGPGRGARPQPRPCPQRGVVPNPQGSWLRQARRRQPRRTPQAARPRVLGGPQGVHGPLRRHVPGRGLAGAGRSGRAGSRGRGQLPGRDERPSARRRAGGLAFRPAPRHCGYGAVEGRRRPCRR